MSLFSRTATDADALATALDLHESNTTTLPIPDRKASLSALQASLSSLQPVVAKFVTKADLGESDPNKRLYGAAMVTKIRALSAKLSDLATRIESEADTVNPLYDAHVRAQADAKAQHERMAVEKLAAEEAARAEAERKQAEDEAAWKDAEEKRIAEEEAKEKELAEKRRQAALALAALAEEKRLAEEAAVEEEKKRAAAASLAKEKEAAAKAAAEKQAAEAAAAAGISLTVKTAKSATLLLSSVLPSCTVAELKKIIAEKHGIAEAAQRLIFQGRMLVDAKTIDSYKIKGGSAIHLVENQRAAAAAGTAQTAAQGPPKPIVPAGTVCHLTGGKAEFRRITTNCGRHRLIVVDWSAAWCGPCRMIAPVFERLAARFSDVTFVKVDTEASPANSQLASEKGISAYPTFHYYIGATMVHSASGANASLIEAGITRCRPMVAAPPSRAGAAASSGGSASGSLTQNVLAALTNLKNNCETADFVVAVRTLLTFVRNVVEHPGQEKYRKVRTANNTFQTRLASKTGGVECMHAFGFEEKEENGESYLVLSEEAAANAELATVRRQLEQALSAIGGSQTPPAQPRAAAPPTAPGGTQTPGAGPMGDLGGLGMDPSMLSEMAQDPSFLQLAQEIAANPSIYNSLVQSQTAMQNGDFDAIRRVMQDPAMTRFMQNLGNNPGLMDAMRRQGMAAGFPGMTGMGGGQGAPRTGTDGSPPAGIDGTGQGQTQTPANGANSAPPAPPYPGAPTTAEEEDRLLQEAIRLSMQDSAANQRPQEPKKDNEPENGQS